MTLRPLSPEDIPAALSLWARVEGTDRTDEPRSLAAFLQRNPGLSRGAFEGGRLVATILAGSDGRRGFLYRLAVDPACQGHGLALALEGQALDALAARGLLQVHSFVRPGADGGLAFRADAARRGWLRRGDALVRLPLEPEKA